MEGNTTQMILFIRNVVLALLFIKKIKKKNQEGHWSDKDVGFFEE